MSVDPPCKVAGRYGEGPPPPLVAEKYLKHVSEVLFGFTSGVTK